MKNAEGRAFKATADWVAEQTMNVTAEQAHNKWVKEMVKRGVRYGFARTRFSDPRLIPFSLLSPEDQRVFSVLVASK